MRLIVRTLLLCGLVFPALVAGAEPLRSQEDDLHYLASYRGWLSAGQWLDIGDVRFTVSAAGRLADGSPLQVAELTATSEAYPVVNSLYPYRYLFRSRYLPKSGRALLFERDRKTRRQRRDLLWIDGEAGQARRYWLVEAGQGEVDPDWVADLATQGVVDLRGRVKPRDDMLDGLQPEALDLLTLLQRLRALPLAEGFSVDIPVTDGKQVMHYRVSEVRRVELELQGRAHAAWKFRLDGSEWRDGGERPGHAPVYIWLEEGGRRRPLRFEHRHAAGLFRVDLQEQDPRQRLAATGPVKNDE